MFLLRMVIVRRDCGRWEITSQGPSTRHALASPLGESGTEQDDRREDGGDAIGEQHRYSDADSLLHFYASSDHWNILSPSLVAGSTSSKIISGRVNARSSGIIESRYVLLTGAEFLAPKSMVT